MLLVTQGAADATDFERVGEAGMDMIVAVDRVDLGLAPQAAKRAREDDAIVVFVKRAAPELFRAVVRFAEAFAVKQGLPIQGAALHQMTDAAASRFRRVGARLGA